MGVSIRAVQAQVASRLAFGEEVEMLHPGSVEETAEMLAEATAKQRKVLIWSGGTHQGIGYGVVPDQVLFTDRLTRLLDWEPDDLTVVIESGAKVHDLETQLATHNQTVVLSEQAGGGTVGGALAAGISGYRRARYGPTRDRVLEVQIVTGDGRVVRGGGRVVKNVTGYDLPRLAVGSLGSIGVIVSTCFKLWPLPPATATITREGSLPVDLYRPLAVLSDGESTRVYLAGTEAEVNDQRSRVGGDFVEGLHWPAPPDDSWCFSLRVPPASASDLVARLPADSSYLHQVGVGEVAIAAPTKTGIEELRIAAEGLGGALVVTRAPDETLDPWGTPPAALDLQRRLIAAFDPARVLNPGRLPGRL
ncbi:FAD-binding oxidoreductase [soil metagenome]